MNANMTEFRWFSKSFESLCLDESSLSIGRVNPFVLLVPYDRGLPQKLSDKGHRLLLLAVSHPCLSLNLD